MNKGIKKVSFLILAITCILVFVMMASGCVSNQGLSTQSKQNTSIQMQRITVTGSTTILPIVEKVKEAFEKKFLSADIRVSGGGSSVGVKAVGEGTVDVGMSSRDLKPEEKTSYPDLMKHEIAWDAIVIIVNSGNSVNQLSLNQIKGIYNGTYTNWKQAGGQDHTIVVVGRDSASGTREYFSENVMKNEAYTKKQEEFNSNGGIQQKVSQTPGAIGYVSLGYADGVKKVMIDVNGTPIEPSIDNINNGTYPLARPLFLLTKGEPKGLAKQFIDFILSPEGQQIVESADYIPLLK